jgi:ligand-binding SRPBCC domain-containing protein
MRLFKRSLMPASAAQVFAFHERADALSRLIPPWEHVRVVEPPTSLAKGTRVVLVQRFGFLRFTIESVHTACEPGRGFVDEMVRGPFRSWVHEHRFEAINETASWLVDDVEYALPLEPLSAPLRGAIAARVERMFVWRHDVTRKALEAPTT